MQLTIPDEIVAEIQREADIRKLTPEAVVLGVLRARFDGYPRIAPSEAPSPKVNPQTDDGEPKTLADFLGDFIGAIDSSEVVPGGARMSENIREKITEILLEKQRKGKL